MKVAAIVLGVLLAIALAFAIIGIRDYGPRVSRPVAEIQLLAQATEAYRTDHGHYPTDPTTTEQLRPNASYDPTAYIPSSAFLYRRLLGKRSHATDDPDPVDYFPDIKPSMLRTTSGGVTYIVDQWGNSIGYSTFKSVHPESPDGENTSFDLWSTGGGNKKSDIPKWIRNW